MREWLSHILVVMTPRFTKLCSLWGTWCWWRNNFCTWKDCVHCEIWAGAEEIVEHGVCDLFSLLFFRTIFSNKPYLLPSGLHWLSGSSKYLYITNSLQHIPSWEANSYSASQEIPRILWNPTVHYHIHKCPSHLSLSHARSVQSMPLHPTSWRPSVGAFAKLRKRLLASSCPFVRPQGTTRLPLDGFSWNLLFQYFLKIWRKCSSLIRSWQY
jgi:hypothetical protein